MPNPHSAAARVRTSVRRHSQPAQLDSYPSVGPWRIGPTLATGARHVVHSAWPIDACPERHPTHVIKFVREQHRDDPATINMLRREASLGRTVSHRHLAPVLAADFDNATPYLVTPLLDGCPLSQLNMSNTLEAIWIGRQIAEALAALHQAGWTHGDITPGNVMVSPEGHATLLDLGLANRIGQSRDATTALAGTLCYAAPETFVSTTAVDPRSDLYSLGVLLFEAITGRPPFTADTPGEWIDAHRQTPAPDLRSLIANIPDSVAWLIRRLLAKQPIRRPATADEVIESLVAAEIQLLAEQFSPRIDLAECMALWPNGTDAV